MGNLFVQGKSGSAPTMIQGLSFENFGTIAQNDVKQFEYFCVCTITVLCRNIIHAGVPDATAYKTSDVVLQKLSVAKTPSEMYQILQNGVAAMEAEVNRVRSATKGNVHVRKARNYIAAHIREKIRLQEIADAIGISSSYLSRVFSQETGKSISQFILEEKMNVACNLLKYSDYSVTNISTYINVVPQSYFSSVFRQIVGSTPQQYRQSHQSVDS